MISKKLFCFSVLTTFIFNPKVVDYYKGRDVQKTDNFTIKNITAADELFNFCTKLFNKILTLRGTVNYTGTQSFKNTLICWFKNFGYFN